MKFSLVHKVCSYLMIASSFGAVALSGELHPALIALVVLLGAASFLVESEEAPIMRARGWTAAWNVVTVAAALGSAVQVFRGEGLPAVGARFLCLLAVNKLWNRHASRDYLQLYVVSFLLLVIGTVLNNELVYAVAFVAYVVFATWALTLFHLRREMESNYLLKHTDGGGTERVAVERILASRRIVGGSFLAGTSAISVSIFLGAAVFFFLMPRIGFNLFGQNARKGMRVGFNESGIELGGNGLIRDNEQVAMRVEFPDQRPRDRLYFRGISFDRYEGGRWFPSTSTKVQAPRAPLPRYGGLHLLVPRPRDGQPPREMKTALRQDIYLEPMEATVLFMAEAPVAIEMPPSHVGVVTAPSPTTGFLDEQKRVATGDVFAPGRQGGVRYTAWSRPDPPAEFELDAAPDATPEERALLAAYLDTSTVPKRVVDLARQVAGREKGPNRKARALLAYLGRGFKYTVDLQHAEGKEPIEEFLFDVREGHCEYFASALALMLRSVGVPTRHIAGFYGGDWNELGSYLQVRQRDAHAWVEAWMGPQAGWVPLDATPAIDMTREAGLLSRLRQMIDVVQLTWFKYVIEYDLGTQIDMFQKARRYFGGLSSMPTGQDAGEWLKAHRRQALAVAAAIALGVAGLVWWRRPRRARSVRGAGVAAGRALDRALRALSRRGFQRGPGETLVMLARRLRERGDPGAEAFGALVDAYYAARFGGIDVDLALLDALARQVARPGETAGSDEEHAA